MEILARKVLRLVFVFRVSLLKLELSFEYINLKDETKLKRKQAIR